MVKSAELNSAINLVAMILLFTAAGPFLLRYLTQMLARSLQIHGTFPASGNVSDLTFRAISDYFFLVSPVFIASILAGLTVNYLQVGFLFTTEPLNPQFNRLNPAEGLKKIVSKRALFELVKTLLKVTLVGLVAILFIRSHLEPLLLTLYQNVEEVWLTLSSMALQLAMRIGLVFLVLAVLDYLYQRYEHNNSLKMTKQEVKEEHKQMEGDPLLRARMRERQRKIVMERMMDDVPRATVVITNPTVLAVALLYRQGEDRAPVVVAKGADLIAGRIRELAVRHNVPLMEDKPLARTLYYHVDVGQEIPVELYQAVAEILAVVYSLKK